MEINTQYLQTRNCTIKPSRKIEFLVIHYTGNVKDTARANAKYFYNNTLGRGAHYFVDSSSIYQSVADKNIAGHCGTTGTYYHDRCRNANSIGIEMCTSGSYTVSATTIANTARLVASLVKKYEIPVLNVVRHYDVTHKLCPKQMVEQENAWRGFKELTYKYLIEGDVEEVKFTDVAENDCALAHVEKLSDAGIINGFADGTFRPDALITRREAAVMVANVLNYFGK